jgi:5-methylcytosine-specific restriction endonuclease McrA
MVELDPTTKKPIRIFKYPAGALFLPPERVAEWPRKDAVAAIREELVKRSGGQCKYCPKTLGPNGGHMHERQWRGHDGEISLDNSVMICADCHIGPKGEHSGRLPKWTANKNS